MNRILEYWDDKMKKKVLGAGISGIIAVAGFAAAQIIPVTAAYAAPTKPTGYAMTHCQNGQWEEWGFSSYNECAAFFWDDYCLSHPNEWACTKPNPFG